MKRLAKGSVLLLTAALGATAALAVSSTPAFAAQTIADGIYTIGSKQGTEVLDVKNGSTNNGAALQTYDANGSLAQAFHVAYEPEHDAYTIMNVKSTKAVGLSQGSAYIGTVDQYDYINADSQRWKFIAGPTNGDWAIQSTVYPYYYLDVLGSTPRLSTAPKYWRVSGEFQTGQVIADGTYIIQRSGTNRVLDIRNGSTLNQAALTLHRYNGTPAQLFRFKYLADKGTYVITNEKSGHAIDRPNGYTKTNLWQFRRDESLAQQWHVYKNGDGKFIILSADSYYGMTATDINDNTQVDQSVRMKTEFPEMWNLVTADNYNLPYSTYQIYSAAGYLTQKSSVIKPRNSYKVKTTTTTKGYFSLDIPNASRKSGANVQLYRSNGSLAQAWILNRTPRGYYLITNVASGKVLDVQHASTKNGANVWQYDGSGTSAQQWDILFDDKGYATILSRLSGKALDVSNARFKNGTNIQVWKENGTKAQKWIITDMKQRTISTVGEEVVN